VLQFDRRSLLSYGRSAKALTNLNVDSVQRIDVIPRIAEWLCQTNESPREWDGGKMVVDEATTDESPGFHVVSLGSPSRGQLGLNVL
jgi:hypothetical protein